MVHNEQFKIERDLENDGYLILKNATTLDLYQELQEKKRNLKSNCFFAFDKKGFNEKIQALKDKGLFRENEKLLHTRWGMFGYEDWLDDLCNRGKEINKQIAENCDPYEVYCYEWNNHECMYCDDELAYNEVIAIFGEEASLRIKRFAY